MLQNPLILAEESKIMRAFQQHLKTRTVADLGEGPTPPPLFWVKKEEITEGTKANRARKPRQGPPLVQGLDPPLQKNGIPKFRFPFPFIHLNL